ncbi:MAG: DNA-directed RNA polymerase subunit beta [Atopococcus tabaci]|uniref:DNA-directed RNA polymerase subunit beta n=1 Tax=Atopococcus tabaci TaxID=269774 RepID=A0AA43UC43_9LACT|nr:DNA-directed RNA polymerase subunit beta [Atopococcus tabaci]
MNKVKIVDKNILTRLRKVTVRTVIIIGVFILLFLLGALIGYSVIGGGNPFDIFTPSFWTTLFDFI